MLTKLDYYKLVLSAFESLERDIADCKEFTINEYNTIISQQKQQEEEAKKESKQAVEKKEK